MVALLPVLATDVFRAGDEGIGILFAARGLGALLGPFIAIRFVRDSDRRLLLALAWSIVSYGFAYLVLAGAPTLALAAAVAVVAHLGAARSGCCRATGFSESCRTTSEAGSSPSTSGWSA